MARNTRQTHGRDIQDGLMGDESETSKLSETEPTTDTSSMDMSTASQVSTQAAADSSSDSRMVNFGDYETPSSNIVKGVETLELGPEVHQPADLKSTNDFKKVPSQTTLIESMTETQKVFIPERICPRVNCPEKIIICLDVSQEMEKVSFRSRAGDKFSPIQLVKRALGLFLHSKHQLDSRHQFVLVLLQEEAHWIDGFTSDPKDIMSFLDSIDKFYPCETFNVGSLFDAIAHHVSVPSIEQPRVTPPPYIVRAILLYGRSHCLPTFADKKSQKLLQLSPHFFFDAYYIHQPQSEENQCEAIYDAICQLDTDGLSYVFEVSRNPTRLYDCMAQLLAHPLQRPLQKDLDHRLEMKTEVPAS